MSIQVKNIEKNFGAFHALERHLPRFSRWPTGGAAPGLQAVVKPPCCVLLQD